MDHELILDIDFNQNHNVNDIIVKKKILFGFFYAKTFANKDGNLFSIKSIIGPFNVYNIYEVDTKDIVSVTFYYCKEDPRPFGLCIEKSNQIKIYYKINNIVLFNWEPISELNEVEKNLQDSMLLYVLKVVFSNFFRTYLNINESSIIDGKTVSGEVTYSIKPEIHFSSEYDRYKIKSDKPNSISTIFFEGKELKLKDTLKYVEELYVYFVKKDLTTPLLIETHDYQIGDDLALYNYYTKHDIYDNKWSSVDSGITYAEPMCRDDLIRVLEEAVRKYKRHPVIINVKDIVPEYYLDTIVMFSGATFQYINHPRYRFRCQEYLPKVGRSFFIQEIVLYNLHQEIEIQSKEISQLFIFFTDEKELKPVLISFRLYKSSEMNNSDFRWFETEKCGSNIWSKIEFDAHPQWDPQKIEYKIKRICGYSYIPDMDISPLKLGILTLGCIIGTTIGMYFSHRVIGLVTGLYRRLMR